MLRLNNLVPLSRKRKRVGRGGSRGGHSGRGGDGQKVRPGAGSEISATFEGGQMPLNRRMPHRGFNNKPFRKKVFAVNINMLETHFEAGEEVTKDTLKAKKVIKGHESFLLKILGNGTLKKKLTVHADSFSKGAVAAIEKVGGKVVLSKETESGGITA